MSRVVVLDSGPLGLLSHPRGGPAAVRARAWAAALAEQGVRLVVPEIADYELRRELVRAGKTAGVARLDALGQTLGYAAITTTAMRLAADLWADARSQGRPTAPPEALDADVILAAQSLSLAPSDDVVVATTNPGHLARYVTASEWHRIR